MRRFGEAFVLASALLLTLLAGAWNRSAIGVAVTVLLAGLLIGQAWLLGALRRGAAVAWSVQLVVRLIGLAGFPLGTLLYLYLLWLWFRPETKAWFQV